MGEKARKMVAVFLSPQSIATDSVGLRLACRSGGNHNSICKLNSQKVWVLASGRQHQGQREHVWSN